MSTNEKHLEHQANVFALAFIGMYVVAFCMAIEAIFRSNEIKNFKHDAVTRGYAEYDGETFKWKDGE